MRLLPLLSGALVVAACRPPAPPPPLQTVQLARWRGTFRSYDAGSICESESRWLFDELASVNGVLDGFLDATRPDEAGRLSEQQLRLIEEAEQVLPTVAAAHAQNVARAQRCPFAKSRGFPMVLERGAALANETRSLLASAPALVERQRALAGLERWRREHPREELSARLGCPERATPRPPLYHAYEDESGRAVWLFCDGARVVGTPGEPRTFEEPAQLTAAQRRRLRPNDYLEAARLFPRDEVSRPPTVPDETATARTRAPHDG